MVVNFHVSHISHMFWLSMVVTWLQLTNVQLYPKLIQICSCLLILFLTRFWVQVGLELLKQHPSKVGVQIPIKLFKV
jgi:hypothetical protein